jgi:hypothetical protein
MGEAVNNVDLFGSGGHVWAWDQPDGFSKRITTVAVAGAAMIRTQVGPRACRIIGRDGGPALLRASGADWAGASAALDALEQLIEDLRDAGTSCPWTDDAGRGGSALVVVEYQRAGARAFGPAGDAYEAWQFYTAVLVELTGNIYG